jgi:Ni,Fe-hydrogenase maturation factor
MNEWEWRALEERPTIARVPHAGGDLTVGGHVRLCPRPGLGDAMDVLLAGKTGIIESIEQDYEGAFHLAIVLDDDPGRDLGLMRQPGHRFFYAPEDVQPLADVEPILIAGIGNVFLGDDGFGVEVAQRLLRRAMPAGVRVVDYGIRTLDLAYALLDAAGTVILVDATSRGGAPGTLYVIEPPLDARDGGAADGDATDDVAAERIAEAAAEKLAVVDAHTMNPMHVIRMTQAMGGMRARLLVVGCEPATFGPDEGQLGLSDRVAAAIGPAVDLLFETIQRIRDGDWPGDGRPAGPRRSA